MVCCCVLFGVLRVVCLLIVGCALMIDRRSLCVVCCVSIVVGCSLLFVVCDVGVCRVLG